MIEESVVEPSEIEIRAMEMGWKPKDQLTDDKEFVEAKEFIARKPLFDRIHSQNEKIKDVEQTLQETAKHVLKVQELAYKKAMSDLQKDRKTAINEADVDRVHEIDYELDQLEAAKPVATAPAEYVAWEKENPWFKQDEELFAFACASYDAQLKRTPNAPLDKVLELVNRVTRRAFPDKFEGETKPVPHSVEGETKPVHQSKQPGYSSLNENQKRVCDNFVKMKIMTKEAYIKSLHEIGEI